METTRWPVKRNSSVTNDGGNFRSFWRGGPLYQRSETCAVRVLSYFCDSPRHKRALSRVHTLWRSRRTASEAIDHFSLVELLSPSCGRVFLLLVFVFELIVEFQSCLVIEWTYLAKLINVIKHHVVVRRECRSRRMKRCIECGKYVYLIIPRGVSIFSIVSLGIRLERGNFIDNKIEMYSRNYLVFNE